MTGLREWRNWNLSPVFTIISPLCTPGHTCTPTRTHANSHRHNTCKHTNTHLYTHARTDTPHLYTIYTCPHIYTQAQHIHTHKHNGHTNECTHMCIYVHARAHTKSCAHSETPNHSTDLAVWSRARTCPSDPGSIGFLPPLSSFPQMFAVAPARCA